MRILRQRPAELRAFCNADRFDGSFDVFKATFGSKIYVLKFGFCEYDINKSLLILHGEIVLGWRSIFGI